LYYCYVLHAELVCSANRTPTTAITFELGLDSVPVNFVIPFEGTPLGGHWELTPPRCLRILAMFRFAFPGVEVRLAGGREIHLRSLQPLALHLVNSMFLGDYLTG
jgi:biotin synthase